MQHSAQYSYMPEAKSMQKFYTVNGTNWIDIRYMCSYCTVLGSNVRYFGSKGVIKEKGAMVFAMYSRNDK